MLFRCAFFKLGKGFSLGRWPAKKLSVNVGFAAFRSPLREHFLHAFLHAFCEVGIFQTFSLFGHNGWLGDWRCVGKCSGLSRVGA